MNTNERKPMDVALYGATGMVGGGVLRECLQDPHVARVLAVGRRPSGHVHPKLEEVMVHDLMDYSALKSRFAGVDACFYCLGISSAGLTENEYRRVTLAFTLAAATTFVRINPRMTFIYVSGAGTDSSARGRIMWARIKGQTENALLKLPFTAAYMLRPGIIQPLHGIVSRTRSYRILYSLLKLILPLLKAAFPRSIVSTEDMGRVMLSLAKDGFDKRVLEASDIVTVSRRLSQRYGFIARS